MNLTKHFRHLLTFAVLACITVPVIAQPLSGAYTIGGTSPDYATLSAAVSALNSNGVSGPVIFNIRNGNYTATTWRATINNVSGASATNRITFKSEANNAANVTISVSASSSSTNFILKLNSASYITIKDLTLANNGSSYGRTIELAGSAGDDSVVNCILKTTTRTSSSTNTAVVFADDLKGTDNVFLNNQVQNGSYGIYYSGTNTSTLADGGTFINNVITNAYGYGAYFYYTENLSFVNNTITSNSTNSTTYGFRTYYCDGAMRVTGNKISGFNGYGMYLYYCDATPAARGLVANNTVIMKNGTGTNRGLQNYYSSYQTICNNTINVTGTSSTSAYAGYFYYSSASYTNNEIYNNVFSNTGGGYALFVYNPIDYDNHWDYNNIYTTGAKLIDRGTPATDYYDLSSWRTATGQDMNSIVYNPAFTNAASDLTPDPSNPSSWSLNGRGIQVPLNDKDINGNARPVTLAAGVPDIGAFEFTPTVIPPNAVASPAAPVAGATQYFLFGQDTVATVSWDAASVLPASIAVKQYTGTLPSNISSISPTAMYFYTDIIVPAGTYNFGANIYYKDPWLGTILGEGGLRLAKKLGANPWNAYVPPASGANINRNIIATTGLADFGSFTGIDMPNNASAAVVTDPTGFFCSGNFPVKVKIKNTGNNVINNVLIDWEVNGVAQSQIVYNTAIPTLGEVIVTLGNISFNNKPKKIKVWTSMPNGQPDLVNNDDTTQRKISGGLSGNYTVGGTTPDFVDFVEAVHDLKDFGVCGPVVFNIRDGVYTGQASLNAPVNGMSAVNTVTFQSENHIAGNVVVSYDLATSSDNYVFKINDISYLTLRDITFRNNNTDNGRVIEMAGNGSHDSILNCSLIGPVVTSSSNSTAVLFADNYTGSDNVFMNNTVRNGSYGIYYSGTSTSNLAERPVFINNKIQDVYTYSTYFYYTEDLVFNNNTISSSSTATLYGIRCYYCDGGIRIMNNKVTGFGAGYGLYLYYNDATAANPGLVANNVISIGNGSSTARGIQSYYSNYQRIYNNSVNITSSSTTGGYAGYFYYNSTSYLHNEIRNNVFANTGGGYALYVYNPTYDNNWDYNNLYTTGTNLVDRGTPAQDFTSLTDWRVASGQEMNSVSYNPGFISSTDLRPDVNNPAAWSLNGRGIHLAGNDKDFFGGTRVTTLADGVPDIGAYEFVPVTVPPVADATPAIPAAGTTQVFTFGEDTVAVIAWKPNSVVPGNINVRQYTGTKPTQFPVSASMYFYTDVDVLNITHRFDAKFYYKDPWRGTTGAEAQLKLAQKLAANPWNAYNDAASTTDDVYNTISANDMTSLGKFTGIDNGKIFSARIVPLGATVFCPGGSVNLQANTGTGFTYQWQFNGVDIPGATSDTYNATAAGDYTVKVTDGNNVTAVSLPVAITIVSSPAAVINASGPLNFCPGGTLTLSANTGNGLTYQWQFNGSDIPGATSASVPVTGAGKYTVTVANIGCSVSSPVTVVAPGPLHVNLGLDTSYCASSSPLILDAGYPGASYTWSTGATTQQVSLANQSGKFWVYVDAGPNCQAADTIEVNVNPLPSVTGISYFKQGANKYSFSPSGSQNAVNYLWLFSDGYKSTSTNVDYINNSGNEFTVKLVVFNACGTDTAVLTLPLSVDNIAEDALAFRLYPNPATSEITFSVDGKATFNDITILNSVGQVVYRGNAIEKNKEIVDVSALPAGHYIMRANTTGGIITKPFEVVR